MLSWADAAEKPWKELLECTEVKAEERKHRLTGMGCREVPHQPGLPGRRGRTRSCRSECSTQPGPAEHKAPLYLCNLSPRESTPPCKHHQLSLLSLCSHRTSLPSAPPKLHSTGRKQLFPQPGAVLALLQLSESPAALQAASTVPLRPLKSIHPPALHPVMLLSC